MLSTILEPSDLVPAPAHVYGPTWRHYEDGRFWLPEASLGWAVINWMTTYLRDPGDSSRPFLPTPEQAR